VPAVRKSKSTTVRSVEDARKQIIKRLRVAVGWVQRVSPTLAARAVELVWLTPQRHQRPPSEHAAFDSAHKWQVSFRKRVIPMYSWGEPGRPVVLFAHGWEGRATQVSPYIEPLLNAGFRVVSYDAPAHGEARRALVSVIDFARLAEHVSNSLRGQVQAGIGHSAGAAALLFAAGQNQFAERLVVIAAPLSPRTFLEKFSRWLRLTPVTQRTFQGRLDARYGLSFADFDNRPNAVDSGADGLVVHDRRDPDVPFEHAETLASAWPGARLLSTDGLGHRRVLRDAEVVRRVLEFIGPPRASVSLQDAIAGALVDRQGSTRASA
jgi:pimeloyl-ACP methyl ester carboxylesterase